jgi:hypothetical protein
MRARSSPNSTLNSVMLILVLPLTFAANSVFSIAALTPSTAARAAELDTKRRLANGLAQSRELKLQIPDSIGPFTFSCGVQPSK